MRLPSFDLPATDGSRLTDADLRGEPHFLYLARHPGCYVCQHALGKALVHRDALRAAGGDIVVFFNAKVDYTTMWAQKSDLPDDLKIVMDPDAGFYEALGTIRGGLLDQAKHALGDMWQAKGDIRKWKLSSNDMLRMGADVGVGPDGEVLFHHVCQSPADRADPRAVLDALPVAA